MAYPNPVGSKIYTGPSQPIQLLRLADPPPPEGKKFCAFEFDWNFATAIEVLQIDSSSTGPFTRICMLDVDNSQSGADVTFLFFDTGDTLNVPAYSSGCFPVFTNGTRFTAWAPQAIASDITRVRALNYTEAPIDNLKSVFTNTAVVGGIALAAGTTNLIAVGATGTMVAMHVPYTAIGGAAAGTITATIQEIGGPQILNAGFSVGSGAAVSGTLLTISDINWRFKNGVSITLSLFGTAPASGFIGTTLLYRTP